MATLQEAVVIKPLNLRKMEVRIVGETGLIVHAWSEKAKKEILDKQQKKTKAKEIRNPEAEYEASFYHFPGGGYGFPAIGVKACLIGAAHKDLGIEKTLIRKAVYIHGTPDSTGMQLVKIIGEPKMRQDMVTIGMGTADLRYRPEFHPWSIDLLVTYNADMILPESLVNLLNSAGFGVGLGEWRPERGGVSGMFKVGSREDLEIEAAA